MIGSERGNLIGYADGQERESDVQGKELEEGEFPLGRYGKLGRQEIENEDGKIGEGEEEKNGRGEFERRD